MNRCRRIEVSGRDCLCIRICEAGNESQGQRVIRLISIRPGKLSGLGDEK